MGTALNMSVCPGFFDSRARRGARNRTRFNRVKKFRPGEAVHGLAGKSDKESEEKSLHNDRKISDATPTQSRNFSGLMERRAWHHACWLILK